VIHTPQAEAENPTQFKTKTSPPPQKMSARGGNEGRQTASGGGTQTQVLCESVGQSTAPPSLVLKLKSKKKASVTWEEGTVNNENCGRKSSKRKATLFSSILSHLGRPLLPTLDYNLFPRANAYDFPLLSVQGVAYTTRARRLQRAIRMRAIRTLRKQRRRMLPLDPKLRRGTTSGITLELEPLLT